MGQNMEKDEFYKRKSRQEEEAQITDMTGK